MPEIVFDHVSKDYGSNRVVKEFSADVADGEFLVLLGPSGCGKSTMLRMIAGLTDISSGSISFDGKVVNDLEPKERSVAFVFQSYALYPHMTVRQNIAFPLVMDRFRPWYHLPILGTIMRRVLGNRPDVKERVSEVATMLELDDYLDRRPKALSGGQRQRVAVARALVRNPAIYLLDEPLSNLDAKLRAQMRVEISELYRRVEKSFVYVTHDQVEAMTMATRIVVLNRGEVRQIGTPQEIYDSPADTFVATFIGSPPMNLIPVSVGDGRATTADGQVIADGVDVAMTGQYLLGVRPEKISLSPTEGEGIRARVVSLEHLGGESVVEFSLTDSAEGKLVAPSEKDIFRARLQGVPGLSIDDHPWLTIDPAQLRFFDADSGLAVTSATEGAGDSAPQGKVVGSGEKR